ncbi:alpha/beta hydrolase family protein [Mesoflavibacter sp. CH_XMU1422-2]|uniref:alpha/beta hydrolase family protein n=1 Tax=Mesoflavibacter sp. CH_XMU1422-2 TaxID=3107770 RepID=UPI00300B3EBC
MINKNLVLKRKNNKPIVWDAFFNNDNNKKPLVIFCHGYKGFKDWGAWNLVAEAFMKANVFFVKFNFSHNGGTVEQPIDFPDLEAFAENNYSKEIEDLDDMITFLTSKENKFLDQIDINNISVIGHSRGGGISILKTKEDQRIKKLITWASVSSFGKRTSTTGNLEQWKKDGVKYVLNGRTNQKMPHNFQFYLDFKANEQRLNIENAVKNITVPHLIIHAKDDPSVLYQEAINLNNWNPKSELFTIDNSNHVFDAKHPWKEKDMPNNLEKVINKTIAFIKR